MSCPTLDQWTDADDPDPDIDGLDRATVTEPGAYPFAKSVGGP